MFSSSNGFGTPRGQRQQRLRKPSDLPGPSALNRSIHPYGEGPIISIVLLGLFPCAPILPLPVLYPGQSIFIRGLCPPIEPRFTLDFFRLAGDRKPTFVKCPGLRSGVTINKSTFISIACMQFSDRVILQKSGLIVRNQSAEVRGENKELCRCREKMVD